MTVLLKTSLSSPLRIAEISVSPLDGRLGLTLCPGKKDRSQGWDRDLATDVRAIRNWGATTVVTLIEEHEFCLLANETLAEEVRRCGMDWLHLPIRDVDIPDERFEQAWNVSGPAIHERLDAGQRVLIHCRGGLGRTGLVAASSWLNEELNRGRPFIASVPRVRMQSKRQRRSDMFWVGRQVRLISAIRKAFDADGTSRS